MGSIGQSTVERNAGMKRRKLLKCTDRISTITNCFVQAIIPTDKGTPAEEDEAYRILGVDRQHMLCVYCGKDADQWDHFYSLVSRRGPSGYFDEIRNLVPCCAKCNSSKGGRKWREWMNSSAKDAPRARGITDQELQDRTKNLEEFEKWGKVKSLPLEALKRLAGKKEWRSYWALHDKIEGLLTRAQQQADIIRERIKPSVRVLESGEFKQ